MRYYPIYLDIRGRACIVIGGGEVAERKVVSLLNAGAKVRVVSPVVTESLKEMSGNGMIGWKERPYRKGDLKGAFMAYAATDDEDISRKISEEAHENGVLLNLANEPEICDFIVPSVVERGRLSIAISTGGASPAFAKRVRLEMEVKYGEEYAVFLDIMAAIRQKLLTKETGGAKNRKIFNKLASSTIPEMIKGGRWKDVDRTIISLLGEEFSIASLGIKKA